MKLQNETRVTLPPFGVVVFMFLPLWMVPALMLVTEAIAWLDIRLEDVPAPVSATVIFFFDDPSKMAPWLRESAEPMYGFLGAMCMVMAAVIGCGLLSWGLRRVRERRRLEALI